MKWKFNGVVPDSPYAEAPPVAAEARLLLAILQRAILDICGDVVRWESEQAKKNIRLKARQWVMDWKEADRHVCFTFPWICSELNMNPYVIRKRIRALIRANVRVRMTRAHSTDKIDWILEEYLREVA